MTSVSLGSTCRTHSKGKPGDPSSARTAKDQSSIRSIKQGISRFMPVDERTFAAEVAGWVTEVLNSRPDLPFSHALVEAWISQIELNSLNMRPSGMEQTIKLHTEPVNGHAIRSIPPLSWRNHLLTSLKVRNPRPLPKRLPRGGLFVLNDPITLSPIPSLPEWTILAPAEAG